MKVLLVGNTGYVTEEFVEEAFPECQVMVLGNKMIKTVRRRELISRPFPRTELELGDIFRTYEFEAVVYFSNYLTLHGELEGEAENLRKILQYCRKGVQSHFLYVTGPEGMYDVPTGKTLLVQNAEDVCRRYAGLYGLRVKILRVPYLYSGTYKKDFFYKIFQASKESQKLFFREAPEQKACFLYSMDLAELMYKLFDNWNLARLKIGILWLAVPFDIMLSAFFTSPVVSAGNAATTFPRLNCVLLALLDSPKKSTVPSGMMNFHFKNCLPETVDKTFIYGFVDT